MQAYRPADVERRAKSHWQQTDAYRVGEDPAKSKFYCVSMLPYPSGILHMGHVRNYTLGDVLARFMRAKGFNVLHPMGWDAFGLPAENAAIREGRHPRETIERNIETMRAQMKRLGWAIDWDREVAAHQPTFYRWTQWLFQQFVARGLGYRKEGPVNWCPNDQTVVANEYVELQSYILVFAFLFVIFDVESVFLFPWAVVFVRLGYQAVVEMAIFVFILGLGLLYAYRKKVLQWA